MFEDTVSFDMTHFIYLIINFNNLMTKLPIYFKTSKLYFYLVAWYIFSYRKLTFAPNMRYYIWQLYQILFDITAVGVECPVATVNRSSGLRHGTGFKRLNQPVSFLI